MSSHPQSGRTQRWRWVVVWLGLVALAIALSMAEMYSSKAVTDKPVSLSLAFRRSVEEWTFWGVLSLGVWWLARRYPLESTRLSRWLGLHIAGSIVATVVHAFGYAWLLDGQMSIEGTMFVFPVILRKILIFHSVFSLLI